MAQRKETKPRAGIVYVLTNECLKPIDNVPVVKIGKTTDLAHRLGNLNSAVYTNFKPILIIETNACNYLEDRIFNTHALAKTRKEGTEFFVCQLNTVVKKIECIVRKFKRDGYTAEIKRYNRDVDLGRSATVIKKNHEKAVKKPTERAKPRTAPFSFDKVGIAKGEKLVFIPTEITVTVADEKKIEYKGATYSLSGFCKQFMPQKNASGAYEGPKYFSYKGKMLSLLRKEREATGR